MNKTFWLNHKHHIVSVLFSIIAALLLSGCWGDAAPIPHPISTYGFAQCAPDVNTFYVVGGRDEWNSPLDNFMRYDVSTQTWYRLAPLPMPTIAPAAVCYQGHIYVVTYEQHLYVYDIAGETWSEVAPPPRAAWGAAISAWDGTLYMVSGSPFEWALPVNTVDRYDIDLNTWQAGTATPIPQATYLPGYTQAGPYLFVVGGYGANSPAQNVSATQRYDMSTNTWELGPTFSSARAAFALIATSQRLYSLGGDMNGNDYLDETNQAQSLDLTAWPQGAWIDEDILTQSLMFNSNDFCTTAAGGGEVWSVGGAIPDWGHLNAVASNQYAYRFNWGKGIDASQEPFVDLFLYTNSVLEAEHCLRGAFNLAGPSSSQAATGRPGEVVVYPISFTNTGNIPDAYHLDSVANWPISVSTLEASWPSQTQTLVISITVPLDAQPGDSDTAQITITSQGDPSLSINTSLITTRYVGLALEPPEMSASGLPGQSLSYPITLYNATGQTDSFDLVLGAHTWDTALSISSIGPLPDAGAVVFTVTVNIPADATWNLTDTVIITATGQTTPFFSDSARVTSQAYAPPQISVDPLVLESTQFPGQVINQPLVISNGDGMTLTFFIASPPGFEDLLIRLPLDEPSGATTFHDFSGQGNQGSCTEPYCPTTGVPGRFGFAAQFDGINDYIQLPELTNGKPEGSISLWFKVFNWDPGFAGTYFWSAVSHPPFSEQSWDNINLGAHPETGNDYLRFGIWGGWWNWAATQIIPTIGEWYHIVGTWGSSGIHMYVNGNLEGSNSYTGPTPTASVINGLGSSSWPDTFLDGLIDEVVFYERALSPEDVLLLYQGGEINIPWLSIEPTVGIVPGGSATPIQVTFDSTGLQPGTYTTILYISSNDPSNPSVQIPVTMTVAPTTSMGWMEGYVTDLRTGEPLEASILAEGQPYTVTSDSATGYYKLWLEAGDYTLHINAPGYVTENVSATIIAQQEVIRDFALLLDAPWMQFSPTSLENSQFPNQIITQTLTISNGQGSVLSYTLFSGGFVDDFTSDSDMWEYTYDSYRDPNEEYAVLTLLDSYQAGIMRLRAEVPQPFSVEFRYRVGGGSWSGDGFTLMFYKNIDYVPGTWGSCLGFGDSDNNCTAEGYGIEFDALKNGNDDPSDNHIALIKDNVWNHLAYVNDTRVEDNQWHQVRIVVNENDLAVFLDDELVLTWEGEFDHMYSGFGFSAATGAATNWHIIDDFRLLPGSQIGSWLWVDPASGTIPTNNSQLIQATFDSTGLHPGTYNTILWIASNDPLNPSVQVPVTMTVEPTASMGWAEGYITDLRTGEPLAASIIANGQPYTVTSDVETGYYKFWLESGSYTLTAGAPGYVGQNASVTITAQQGVTQDFALLLDAPWMEYSPQSFESTQYPGEIVTQTLAISNVSGVTLTYYINPYPPESGLILHLDEPAGSNIFIDSSGLEHNGSCTGTHCPETGVTGRNAFAADFDGEDDYIVTTLMDNSNSSVTLSAWVYPESLDNYGSNPDQFGLGHSIINGDYSGSYGNGFGIDEDEVRVIYNDYWLVNQDFPYDFSTNHWYHIAAVYNIDAQEISVYVNGQLIATKTNIPFSGGGPSDPYYIGYKPGVWNVPFYGRIDEVVVYNRALHSNEVMTLYSVGAFSNVSWLNITPISGTLPVNTSIPIQITFDANSLQPGVYTTTLHVTSNDPLNPLVNVPVTMTVTAPAWYGTLSGTITTPGYCDSNPGVLAGAQLLIESSTGLTWTLPSDATGHYAYWLDENGSPYTVTASLPGYATMVESGVAILGQQNTSLDFGLRLLAPCLDLVPQQLPITLQMGMTATLPLTLTNTGGGVANFEWVERNQGTFQPVKGEIVEVNIPAGPIAAPAGSAIAAGPYIPRPERAYTVQRQAILVDPPQVLLLHADDGDGEYIRGQLLAYGDLAAVDSFNARLATPSLADLLPYEVILTWSNYPYADPQALGDVLADYVDAGGYVINLMYALGDHGWELEGRFADEGYTAIQGGLVEYGTQCLGSVFEPHPILVGVSDVCEFYRLSNTSLTPGSTAIARWEDGELFVATNRNRSVVSITGYVGYYFRWTGQMDLMIHNTILWLTLGEDVPWLDVVPGSGSVPGDGSTLNMAANFDTLHCQPGEYIADLLFFSNDPQIVSLHIPVTMTVEPTVSAGWVEGYITDLRTGDPLEATIVAEGQPYTITSDVETGYYKLWLESGSYTLTASAEGYVTESVSVTITAQEGIARDFALLLDAPWLGYAPERLESSQVIYQVTTQTLTISNTGAVPLEFSIWESVIADPVLALHFDEPAGATTFYDASGNGYHGFCSGSTCPTAGVAGRVGSAVSFDGVNDFIQVPAFSMGGEMTVGAWVYARNVYAYFARVMDFSNGTYADNVFLSWEDTTGGMRWSVMQGSAQTWINTSEVFPENEWVHVAATVDDGGTGAIYWNGILMESGQIYVPLELVRNNQYIARSPWSSGAYFNGMMDEFVIYDRALSSEEVMLLYNGGSVGNFPWLSINPISSTVPVNNALPVQVTFDATTIQPGTYTTTICITSNDPLIPFVQVPVTMTVEPTASMGWVDGYVTDLRTGEPLEASIIAAGQPYTVTSDAETGYYKFWLEAGSYTLTASAPGYVAQSASVTITAQQGATQDFALLLDAPWLGYAPSTLESTQLITQVITQTLILTNFGSIPLEFNLGGAIANSVLLLHLDEALGSTTFYDYSGYENHGACSGNSCPQAGQPGILGTAIVFDGNDFIIIPNAPELNPQEAISFSAWIYPYDWNTNRRILQKGNGDSQYRFMAEGGAFHVDINNVGRVTTSLPTPQAWHHVVGIYDGTKMQIWIDGQLSAETPASGQIPITDDPLHIGTKYAGAPACDYFYGVMDEVMVFDHALSADEVMALYTGALGDLPTWLSIEPSAGIVPSGSTTPVQVTFDSTGLKPGVYTTTLYISSNDPLNTFVQVPVTMTVILSDTLITGLQASNDSPTMLGSLTTFTATVTAGTNVIYTWDFGDGALGSGAIATHTYATPGLFVAAVTAVNSSSSLTETTLVTITDIPIAGLVAVNDSPTLIGSPTTFTATITTGTNVTFTWNFGDGMHGSGAVAAHTYAASGVYTATVTATNSLGPVSATTVVQVTPPLMRYYLPWVQREPLPPQGGGGQDLFGLGMMVAVCGVAGWKGRRF